MITLETQKCRKRAPHSIEFIFFNNCDRQKRFRRTKEEGQIYKICLNFFIFAPGLSYGLSKFSDDFTPFLRLSKAITKSLHKKLKLWQHIVAKNMMNKCAKFHGDSPKGKKVKFNLAIELSEMALSFCVQLYRNPMQASNFCGTFDRLFL